MPYSQEHFKTMVYAIFGGQTECIMGNSKIENAEFGKGSVPYCHISAIWLPIAGSVMVVLVHCSGIGYGNLTQ